MVSAVDMLVVHGMQEVSGSSPLSSTGQKRNSKDSNSEYSRKVQQRWPVGLPYVCSDRACFPAGVAGRTPGSGALKLARASLSPAQIPVSSLRDSCCLIATRASWRAIPARDCLSGAGPTGALRRRGAELRRGAIPRACRRTGAPREEPGATRRVPSRRAFTGLAERLWRGARGLPNWRGAGKGCHSPFRTQILTGKESTDPGAVPCNYGVHREQGWVSGTETLPMPAVLIVDAQHTVRRADVRWDYTSPVEVREILAGLETLR
jgi:hypothetical protein